MESTDDMLCRIAEALSSDDEIERLGKALRVKLPAIKRHIKTNLKSTDVTAKGTRKMLRKWSKTVHTREIPSRLKTALEEVNLGRIAEMVENRLLQEKKYAVVEFNDGVAAVSTTWMTCEKGPDGRDVYSCWWPSRAPSKSLRKMAKRQVKIDEATWDQHCPVRILTSSNDWERIIAKEKRSQDTSGLDTEDEVERRRQAGVPSRYESSSDEETLPKVPAFPQPGTSNAVRKEMIPPPAKLPRLQALTQPSASTNGKRDNAPQDNPGGNQTAINRGFEVKVIKLLTGVNDRVKELEKRVEHSASLLQDLCHEKSGCMLKKDPLELDLDTELPVESLEALDTLEGRVANQDFARRIIAKLGVLGGKDVQSTGKTILRNLIDPAVARQLNWTGAKGKREFQSLEIINVILRAVRQNPTSREATREDVKSCIIRYLYNSRDLKGGRNKRKASGHLPNRHEKRGETEDIDE